MTVYIEIVLFCWKRFFNAMIMKVIVDEYSWLICNLHTVLYLTLPTFKSQSIVLCTSSNFFVFFSSQL